MITVNLLEVNPKLAEARDWQSFLQLFVQSHVLKYSPIQADPLRPNLSQVAYQRYSSEIERLVTAFLHNGDMPVYEIPIHEERRPQWSRSVRHDMSTGEGNACITRVKASLFHEVPPTGLTLYVPGDNERLTSGAVLSFLSRGAVYATGNVVLDQESKTLVITRPDGMLPDYSDTPEPYGHPASLTENLGIQRAYPDRPITEYLRMAVVDLLRVNPTHDMSFFQFTTRMNPDGSAV